MKRNNKKGFTIVELVIVIAVIAILSAVLIPTFGGIIDDANETSRDQEAKNALTEAMIDATTEQLGSGLNGYIVINGYYYQVTNNNIVDLDKAQSNTKPEGTITVIACNTCEKLADCTHD